MTIGQIEWLLGRVETLPLARHRNQRPIANPLSLEAVPILSW